MAPNPLLMPDPRDPLPDDATVLLPNPPGVELLLLLLGPLVAEPLLLPTPLVPELLVPGPLDPEPPPRPLDRGENDPELFTVLPSPPDDAFPAADPKPPVGNPPSGCPKRPLTVVFASP